MDDMKKTTGERLKELADLNGMDYQAFAEKCGIKPQRMKNLMADKGKMRMEEAIKVLNSSNVSADFIFGYYPYPFPAPRNEMEVEVYNSLGKASPEELKALVEKLKEQTGETE